MPRTARCGGYPLTEALAPLRERYAHWLQLDPSQVRDDREEAAQDIRAMQLVLRMERATPPSWRWSGAP